MTALVVVAPGSVDSFPQCSPPRVKEHFQPRTLWSINAMTTSETTTNRPVQRFRSGSVSASIWKNEPTSGGNFYSVTFSRSYRQDEEWKNADSFGARDLLDLRRVIGSAEQFIAEQPV